MRPYDGYYEDFDDLEEFAYNRSQALHKLIDDQRREERQRNRSRSFARDHRREAWELDDDVDWDSYVDDSCSGYFEDINGHY